MSQLWEEIFAPEGFIASRKILVVGVGKSAKMEQ